MTEQGHRARRPFSDQPDETLRGFCLYRTDSRRPAAGGVRPVRSCRPDGGRRHGLADEEGVAPVLMGYLGPRHLDDRRPTNRKLVAAGLEARSIRMNEFDNEPNQAGKEHDERESGQEEIYTALRGSGVIVVRGKGSHSSRAATSWSSPRRHGRSWPGRTGSPTSSSAPSPDAAGSEAVDRLRRGQSPVPLFVLSSIAIP